MSTRKQFLALLLAALLLMSLPGGAFAEETADVQTVEAATVEELLAAIAPDTVIRLTGRSYDLTRAKGYGVFGSRYYNWNGTYDDGFELEISGVEGLTIEAARPGAEIVTVPRYACVMKFTDCADVTLRGFTAGHTEGAGYCTGAVLGMTGCRDMLVESCDLYGCGTYGLELERCRGVHAVNTVIRDCSYGALDAANCSDVLLDDCMVHGIEGYGGIFSLRASHDCAVINSDIRDCASTSLVELSGVKDCFLGGCEIRSNTFTGMFSCALYPLVVEGCAFENNRCDAWYADTWQQSERVVDRNGDVIYEGTLETLTRAENVRWEAPAEAEISVTAPPVSEDGMVHVRTVDELLAAIAPDTAIYLEDGVYDLSEAAGYGSYSGDHWYWMSCYDGPGLVIRDVDGLTIQAAGAHRARIVAEPRYCEVLSFEGCRNITLWGFTAGHTENIEAGECAGGVLNFQESRDVEIEDCSLFGCGTVGVTAVNCRDMRLVHTEIHHCTVSAVTFYGSRDIEMSACNVHDIGGGYPVSQYQIYDCKNITADGRAFPENNW